MEKTLRILVIGMSYFVIALMAGTTGIEERESALHLADCISEAANAVSERKIAVGYSHEHQDLVSQVLKKINKPVILNTAETRNLTEIEKRTVNDVILVFKDVVPKELLAGSLWDGHTRFLIITSEPMKMEKYFQQFWLLKVVNVFAMVANGGEISLHSFLPYRKKNCTAMDLVLVDSCVGGKLKSGALALKDSMRIKNMNECPVTITVTDVKPNVIFEADEGQKQSSNVKGFEGNLITEVANIYNFRARFKLPNDGIGWGWIYPSPHGAVSEAFLGISDIVIGMLAPLPTRYHNLDVSKSFHVVERLTFSVPRGYGPKKSAWITIFLMEFSGYTWALIIFSFAVISIAIWSFNRSLNLSWFSNKPESILLLFSSCLGVPVKTPNSTSAKTLIAVWVTYTFIITVAYKGSMGSKLTVPPRDPDIDTFRELLQTDLKLCGLKNMYQGMANVDSWVFKKLRERYNFENFSVSHAVDCIANGEKLAYLIQESTISYFVMMNPKARGRIHVLTEYIYIYQPIVLTKKYSHFTWKISQTISRLEEFGILTKWRAEYLKVVPPPGNRFFSLSIAQIYGIFYFLLFGYVFALFSFLSELFFYSY